MRKNLVIVRAGDKSLHPQWLDSEGREWDLVVSYYGNFPERYKDQYDFLHLFNGSKWEGLSNFIEGHQDMIGQYDYVWMPDDDIFTNCRNINAFFRICAILDLTIAQPALTAHSYFSWPITLQERGTLARLTNFVEIMAPCFKVKNLPGFSAYFCENTSGWGYESLWLRIAEENDICRMAIIDQTPVFHTRPVGKAGHGGSRISPEIEMRTLLARYGLQQTTPAVFGRILAENT